MRRLSVLFLPLFVGAAFGLRAEAQTLPGTLPSSMPILTSGTETFTGNAAIPGGGTTVTVGAYEYFLVGGGGGGGNPPGGDGQANGGSGGARVSGGFTLGTETSFTVAVGAGGATGSSINDPGFAGGPTSITGVNSAGGGAGGSPTAGTGGGAAGTTNGSITGDATFLYGGGGGDGNVGTQHPGGASGGGDGATLGSGGGGGVAATSGAANSGGGGGGGVDVMMGHRAGAAGGTGRAFIHYYGNTSATSGGTTAFENTVNAGTDTTRRFDAGGTLGIATAAASQTAIFPGDLSGGALTKAGLGTLVLSGTNTYSTTTISTATLQIGNAGTTGTLGTGAVSIASGASLVFDRTNSYTVTNTISGAGTLTQNGSGTTVLDGASANTYTGLTSVNNGTLELSKPASTNAFGGDLVIGDGAGAAGSAVVRLAATEQIPDGSAITINSDGLLDLFGNDETVGSLTLVSGHVVGSVGTDTLTLTGDVTSSGTSSIGGKDDTLDVNGNDLNVSSGTLTVTRHVVDTSAAPSQLVKDGPGHLELGGGATLGGPGVVGIDILGGSVAITNCPVDLQGGDVDTNGNLFGLDGGILQNVDTIFGTLDQTGGTLINSLNSPDTMTITGDYNQTGGTLVVDIAGESLGQYDIYSVGGSANLDGTLKVNLLGGFQPGLQPFFWDVVVASAVTIGPSFSLDVSMAPLARPEAHWAYERVDLGGGLFALRLLYVIPTPEPASVLVWGVAGLAALFYGYRRRPRYLSAAER